MLKSELLTAINKYLKDKKDGINNGSNFIKNIHAEKRFSRPPFG